MKFSLCIIDVGHALRAFSLRRLVNKWIFRGKIHKDSSLFFFFFFFFVIFPWDPWVGLDFFLLFFFFLGGGGGGRGGGWWSEGKWDSGSPWVVSTSGLLPENTGIQREMNNWGGGGNS